MSVGVPGAGLREKSLNVTTTFSHPDTETIALRVLADRAMV